MTTTVSIPPSGGAYTQEAAYFPPPVIGSGTTRSGWAGSGAAVVPESAYIDDGSTTWTANSAYNTQLSQGRKAIPWQLPQWQRDHSLGSAQPNVWGEFGFYPDNPAPSYGSLTIASQAYFGNAWNGGETGPLESAISSSRSWVAVSTEPGIPDARTGSVKAYPANQLNIGADQAGAPLSQFQRIRSRAWSVNPLQPADASPAVIYEEAWDCYLHFDGGGTVEVMFWTYNHNQDPGSIGPYVETVDLGAGPVWDLYVSTPTLMSGGQADDHPYGIFCLRPQYQGDAVGWVDLLRGLRYFCMYFARPSYVSSPLDMTLWQVTHGWEVCNTEFSPLPFRLVDYQLDIA
jgi:hypothetical protein